MSRYGFGNSLAPRGKVAYDDLQTGSIAFKLPTSNAPTEILWNHGIPGGVEFPTLGFSIGEYIFMTVQTRHRMKLESIIRQHIHIHTPNDGTGKSFRMKLDVISADVNQAYAVVPGSPFESEILMDADFSGRHSKGGIADIPGVNTGTSTIFKMKLQRIAVVDGVEYGSDIYIDFNDGHYEIDQPAGSRTEFMK